MFLPGAHFSKQAVGRPEEKRESYAVCVEFVVRTVDNIVDWMAPICEGMGQNAR
jgi:hypothetical protein